MMATKIALVEVNNVPDYAIGKHYPFWLCTVDDDCKLWFFGAYRTIEGARRARSEGTWLSATVIVNRLEERT